MWLSRLVTVFNLCLLNKMLGTSSGFLILIRCKFFLTESVLKSLYSDLTNSLRRWLVRKRALIPRGKRGKEKKYKILCFQNSKFKKRKNLPKYHTIINIAPKLSAGIKNLIVQLERVIFEKIGEYFPNTIFRFNFFTSSINFENLHTSSH